MFLTYFAIKNLKKNIKNINFTSGGGILNDNRKIIHIDMDAFYASVEQRDKPYLRGKPVVVGGPPESRGVVTTCSYEARKFGIHSAMPSKNAYKRCPYAIFVPPRFDEYRKVSNQIREIFHRYTDLVEPLSLDEAFLDVTNNKLNIEYATTIAKMIKQDILEETNLTASAGVSYNKFLAKLASDYKKPNGLTIITLSSSQEFLDNLPIDKFFGVGKVTSKILKNMGIKTGYDLRKLSLHELEQIFKNRGYSFYQFARGIDYRPVEPFRERKSIGAETTQTVAQYYGDFCVVTTTVRSHVDGLLDAASRNRYNTKDVTTEVIWRDQSAVTGFDSSAVADGARYAVCYVGDDGELQVLFQIGPEKIYWEEGGQAVTIAGDFHAILSQLG